MLAEWLIRIRLRKLVEPALGFLLVIILILWAMITALFLLLLLLDRLLYPVI